MVLSRKSISWSVAPHAAAPPLARRSPAKKIKTLHPSELSDQQLQIVADNFVRRCQEHPRLQHLEPPTTHIMDQAIRSRNWEQLDQIGNKLAQREFKEFLLQTHKDRRHLLPDDVELASFPEATPTQNTLGEILDEELQKQAGRDFYITHPPMMTNLVFCEEIQNAFRKIADIPGGLTALHTTDAKAWPIIARGLAPRTRKNSSGFYLGINNLAALYARFIRLTEDDLLNKSADELYTHITTGYRVTAPQLEQKLRAGIDKSKAHAKVISDLKKKQAEQPDFVIIEDYLTTYISSQWRQINLAITFNMGIFGIADYLLASDSSPIQIASPLTGALIYLGVIAISGFNLAAKPKIRDYAQAKLTFGQGILGNSVSIQLSRNDARSYFGKVKEFVHGFFIRNPNIPLTIELADQPSSNTRTHEDIHRAYVLLGIHTDSDPELETTLLPDATLIGLYEKQINKIKNEIIAYTTQPDPIEFNSLAVRLISREAYSNLIFTALRHPFHFFTAGIRATTETKQWQRYEQFVLEAIQAAHLIANMPEGREKLMACPISTWNRLAAEGLHHLVSFNTFFDDDFDPEAPARQRLLTKIYKEATSKTPPLYSIECNALIFELYWRRKNGKILSDLELCALNVASQRSSKQGLFTFAGNTPSRKTSNKFYNWIKHSYDKLKFRWERQSINLAMIRDWTDAELERAAKGVLFFKDSLALH